MVDYGERWSTTFSVKSGQKFYLCRTAWNQPAASMVVWQIIGILDHVAGVAR